MKPNYKNWMPKGLILSMLCGGLVSLVLALTFGLSGLLPEGTLRLVLLAASSALAALLLLAALWMLLLYRAFSYNGRRQMARQIVDGVAALVSLPEGGEGLDVGCGSGALTIACARRNPWALMLGIDRWGRDYASFSQALCERNADAEGVGNIRFAKGNALRLDFPDERFDAVVSNYVYHNIPSHDRQAILLESLRVLKKGGMFAIHDVFSRMNYGDMRVFVQKLIGMGYERVELLDTTRGRFMSQGEALWMRLGGSALLVGKK
ncbi:MAG: class I SAM-dependent methyltransferase [Bacteroidales bacterium]|nr:class I SAM-dependent methyltransferase [Bacteroidales bacterium]